MTRWNVVLLVALIAGPTTAEVATGETRSDSNRSVLIVVRQLPDGVRIELDGTVVPRSLLLDELAVRISEHGRNAPVIIVLDSGMPIEQVEWFQGAVGKVGFQEIRFFAASAGCERLRELRLGGAPLPTEIGLTKQQEELVRIVTADRHR